MIYNYQNEIWHRNFTKEFGINVIKGNINRIFRLYIEATFSRYKLDIEIYSCIHIFALGDTEMPFKKFSDIDEIYIHDTKRLFP